MLNAIRRYFGRVTAAEHAREELARAQRALLEAQSSREYYESLVACLRVRIKRLETYLQDERT
jgi:hypothetical protein